MEEGEKRGAREMMGSSEGRASRGGWGRMERVMGPLPEARRRVVFFSCCWSGEDMVMVVGDAGKVVGWIDAGFQSSELERGSGLGVK